MGLAEGVAAGNQRDGFFVVHRHAEERLADVLGRCDRVRIAVRPFRIDVDEAHLHGAERLGKLALAAVAFVAQPRALGTPVKLFRFPDVGAAAGEAERLEAHRFERDVACENHQVGPRDLAAVLLLDRPQQPARLVEVGVVRPAIQRRKALLTRAGAAAAIGDAVRARAVPRHADHQTAVVTEIGRPPLLRVRHQGVQVLDHGIEVEGLELLGVVERLAHRIGQGGIAVEDRNVQRVRPPVAVRAFARARKRAFGCIVHHCLLMVTSYSSWRQSRQCIPSGKVDFSDCCDKIL